MPINEVATQKMFKGLVCPFTGKPVTVRVIAVEGRPPLFFSPDAFDPSEPVPESETLLALVGTRNGIAGSLSAERALFCPYTGKPYSITKGVDGYYMRGGFSPRMPVEGASEFAWRMRMRDGIGPSDKPERAKVTFTPPEADPVRQYTPSPKAFSLEHAENALKGSVGGRIAVTVPDMGNVRRRARRTK